MPHKRHPLREFENLRKRLARMAELYESGWGKQDFDFDEPSGGAVPPADILELEDQYVLTIELPGVASQDFDIKALGRNLVIQGECKPLPGNPNRKFHLMERQVGCFRRSFSFPEPISDKDITAHLSDGVLEVTIPKPQREPSHSIEVS